MQKVKEAFVFELDMAVKCAAQKHLMEEAQTLNESNFISPTTLIACEVSKTLPPRHNPIHCHSLCLDDCVYVGN